MEWEKTTDQIQSELATMCQHNMWLKRGGILFEDDPWIENDYSYSICLASSVKDLQRFFEHGNWAIRNGIVYGNLAFINQVNGGDEWWTLKKFGNQWFAFESITFEPMIKRGGFAAYIARLESATHEQCKTLNY